MVVQRTIRKKISGLMTFIHIDLTGLVLVGCRLIQRPQFSLFPKAPSGCPAAPCSRLSFILSLQAPNACRDTLLVAGSVKSIMSLIGLPSHSTTSILVIPEGPGVDDADAVDGAGILVLILLGPSVTLATIAGLLNPKKYVI